MATCSKRNYEVTMQFIRGRVHIELPDQDKRCQCHTYYKQYTITIGQWEITKIIMALLHTCVT